MKISRNNYLSIQGWMITDLKLSGNELLCYALIYGFCQDGETKYAGSSSYICEWLSCSKKTALTTLKALTDKGLIEKFEKVINGVKLCDYAVNFDLLPDYTTGEKITPGGGEVFTPGGGEKITPHIYSEDNYLKDNNTPLYNIPPRGRKATKGTHQKKEVRFIPPTVDEVRAYCKERGNNVDAERFVDFYTSKGWMVGKTKMKDWKAAVRNWERDEKTTVANNNDKDKCWF